MFILANEGPLPASSGIDFRLCAFAQGHDRVAIPNFTSQRNLENQQNIPNRMTTLQIAAGITPIESHCFTIFRSNPFKITLFHKQVGGGPPTISPNAARRISP